MSTRSLNPLILGNVFIGKIKDISVKDVSGDTKITWEHSGIFDDEEFIYYITVDGDTVAMAGKDSKEAWVGGSSVGFHIIYVESEESWVIGTPNYHGNDFGRRGYLIWDKSTSTDVVKYNIYNDNKTGTIDYDYLYDSVDEITIKQEVKKPKTTGTGTGLITISGSWIGGVVNNDYTITITDNGFTHNILGSTSKEIEIEDYSSHYLPYGIVITFENQVSDYVVGDTYTCVVGVKTDYLSDILSEGTWKFGIKSLDAAGNKSGAVEKEIIIYYSPETPINFTLTYDRDNDKLVLEWTDPDDVDLYKINIYTNYSNMFGDLGDYLIDDEVWVQVNPGIEIYEINSPQDGIWKFALSAIDTSGYESETGTIQSITLPTDIDLTLNVVSGLRAVAGIGGTVILTWDFYKIGTSTPTEFRIYKDSSFTIPYEIELYLDNGEYPIQSYTHTTASLVDGTYDFTVRTADEFGETVNTDMVEVTVDSTSPNDPTIIGGVSS